MIYTKEFKVEMIRRKKCGELNSTNRHFKDKVRCWERIYDKLGEAGLEHRKPMLSFEERVALMKRIDEGESISEVAYSVGRQPDYITKLYKIYGQIGEFGLKYLMKGSKIRMKKPIAKPNQTREEQLEKENEYLRIENEYLKKFSALVQEKGKGPSTKQKVMVIDELRCEYKCKLKVLLEVAKISKSTYEYYKSKKHLEYVERKNKEDKELLSKITEIHKYHKSRYGYRRIWLEINKNNRVNHKHIQRLMHEYGLIGIQGKNTHYHSYKADNGVEKRNLLLNKVVDTEKHKTKYVRDFSTSKPNEKWTTDVSEFKIGAGKIYLSPILDMYDGSIVSYDISTSPNFNQTLRMLNQAFAKYDNLEGLIFHSDQGWQYQMKPYQQMLQDRGIRQSFSRKGNCQDNSLMENFFGIMKNEMFYNHENEFKTLDDLKRAMMEYIEYYNNERINEKRKGLTPLEYRNQSLNSQKVG